MRPERLIAGEYTMLRRIVLHFVAPAVVLLSMGRTGGSQTVLLSNNYQGCSARTDIVLVIRNNQFSRQWAGNVIGVDVPGDGTINKTAIFEAGPDRQGLLTITGKIAGASLEADIGRCRMHLSLAKS